MTTPDPIEAAITAATAHVAEQFSDGDPNCGMFVTYVASDGYNAFRGARPTEVAEAAIRAAAPILIAAGREEVADKISALVNAGWQVLRTTGAKDPILEAKLDALDEAAALARGGTS